MREFLWHYHMCVYYLVSIISIIYNILSKSIFQVLCLETLDILSVDLLRAPIKTWGTSCGIMYHLRMQVWSHPLQHSSNQQKEGCFPSCNPQSHLVRILPLINMKNSFGPLCYSCNSKKLCVWNLIIYYWWFSRCNYGKIFALGILSSTIGGSPVVTMEW